MQYFPHTVDFYLTPICCIPCEFKYTKHELTMSNTHVHIGAYQELSPRGSGKQWGNKSGMWCIIIACCYISLFVVGSLVLLTPRKQLRSDRAWVHLERPLFNDIRHSLNDSELEDAVFAHHPINRLQCGSWVEKYAGLHKAILEGKAPQRYAIMRSNHEFSNGLADRLACSVTIFLYALLTERAFLYDWAPKPLMETLEEWATYEPPTHLWQALRSSFIDWRYPDPGPDINTSNTLLLDYNMDKGEDEFHSWFREKDLTTLGQGHPNVVWLSDKADVWHAFDNPHLQPKLQQLGLQQETAFACLFDFLYRPTPEVVHMFKPELTVLLNPQVYKVGVQIRVGDWQLTSKHVLKPQRHPSLFRHYFECADEIADESARPGQTVVYYTIADNPELRPLLAASYGPRIMVNTGVRVEHIVKSKASDQGFKQACGELWVMSLTTSHIITKKSGFGKVPAMVSAQGTQHIYTIDYPMNLFDTVGVDNRKVVGLYHQRRCTREFADDMAAVCDTFTGC